MPTARSRRMTGCRVWSVAAAVFLLLVPSVLAGPKSAPHPPRVPAAADLFVRILQADDLFSYKGRQVTNYWGPGRTVAVNVLNLPPESRRIEYLAPERLRGRLLVSDNRQQWQYDPRSRSLRHRLLLPGATDDDDLLSYTLLRANFLLYVDPQPRTVADRKAWVVTIKRLHSMTLARRLWVDAGSGLILKREIYGEGGKLAVTVAFSDITYHARLDPELFSLAHLAKTPGVQVIPEARTTAETSVPLAVVGAQLAGLAYAPPALVGYRLIGASATVVGRKPLLHLRYSDGLNLVSLFEQRRTQSRRPTLAPGMRVTKIGSMSVHVAHRASLTTLNWDTATLNVTLMGEMGMDSLRSIASEAVQGH